MKKILVKESKFNSLFESIQNISLHEIVEYLNDYSAKLKYSRFGSFEGLMMVKMFLEKNLGKPIGEGSSRIVYEIDDALCLKLAINKKGIQQNLEEISTYKKYKKFSIFTKIYYQDSQLLWIICEKALPIQESDFLNVFGFGENYFGGYEDENDNMYHIDYSNYMNKEPNKKQLFDTFVKWCDDERNGNNQLKKDEQIRHINILKSNIEHYKDDEWASVIIPGYEKQIKEHEKLLDNLEQENERYYNLINKNNFLKEFYEFITKSDTLVGDIYGANLGLVNRNGEACVVLLDYGITNDVFNKFYK